VCTLARAITEIIKIVIAGFLSQEERYSELCSRAIIASIIDYSINVAIYCVYESRVLLPSRIVLLRMSFLFYYYYYYVYPVYTSLTRLRTCTIVQFVTLICLSLDYNITIYLQCVVYQNAFAHPSALVRARNDITNLTREFTEFNE
jgi:hypothetical protein